MASGWRREEPGPAVPKERPTRMQLEDPTYYSYGADGSKRVADYRIIANKQWFREGTKTAIGIGRCRKSVLLWMPKLSRAGLNCVLAKNTGGQIWMHLCRS